MARVTEQYSCQACGSSHRKWQGKCDACGEWNSLIADAVKEIVPKGLSSGKGRSVEFTSLDTIKSDYKRHNCGVAELDRVLGGGFVPGSSILIGGDPGIGKSTILLQAVGIMAKNGYACTYISGEESTQQISMRAKRLGLQDSPVRLAAANSLRDIVTSLEKGESPHLVIIGSIQTMYADNLDSAPGSVSQVRACAQELIRMAKKIGCALILVGHVTKEGALAGPRVLEHIVDTVLYFEGDTHSSYRLVRAFKNRFGAVNELGVFAMTERGLRGVANPSALFLSQHEQVVPGSCVLVTQEGTRPLLVEIQALVDTANVPNPRRLAVGLEQNRLAMLLAVLHRHAGIACFDQDVFLNAVGGVKITEPAADLAVLLAIHSSMRNKPLPRGLVVFGEIGLAGEIRPTPRGQERLKEAAKLGFSIAVIPKSNAPKQAIDGLEVIAVERIEQAIDRVRALEA